VKKGIAEVRDKAGTVAKWAGMVADPAGALMGRAVEALDEKLASATNAISALLPPSPAATIQSPALGLPHAHIAHPPSGPPPIPPTPLPPFGPVVLGTCAQVLINGKQAARCGDIGLNPTCCGIPPMFEIFTGSSKVFIGGARAARANIDITMHCKPAAGGSRAAAMAGKCAAKAAMMAKIAAFVGKAASAVARGAGVVAAVAGKVDQVAQVAAIGVEVEEAVEAGDTALLAAMGLNALKMAAQMAADAAAMAASAAMGKDPVVPPTGTPGMILVGSPNVLIGGVPLPASMAIAQGLLKKLKGRRFRALAGRLGVGAGP
jgi:uncharacterized Zn-binding protein involved in type VI secretion